MRVALQAAEGLAFLHNPSHPNNPNNPNNLNNPTKVELFHHSFTSKNVFLNKPQFTQVRIRTVRYPSVSNDPNNPGMPSVGSEAGAASDVGDSDRKIKNKHDRNPTSSNNPVNSDRDDACGDMCGRTGDHELEHEKLVNMRWKAPEVLSATSRAQLHRYSQQADIYSFGIVLYNYKTLKIEF